MTGKVENFHGINCFFLHCQPISYFIIHVCNQKIDEHSEMTESRNFQTSPYQKLKSNFRVLHLIPIFLGLMCYTKIRKDENKLSIIDLTSYSQSDHILGENSLQSVVKMSQSYFLCDRKSWKFSWNKLFFLSLPTSFLFHNTCFQSNNLINTLKRPNPETFKLHHVRGWNQILEFYISYQFF